MKDAEGLGVREVGHCKDRRWKEIVAGMGEERCCKDRRDAEGMGELMLQ